MYTEDIGMIWRELVGRGEITSKYKRNKDDLKPSFEIGLENTVNGPAYYALDISSEPSKRLPGEVLERFIDGTDFVIQYNAFRAYKPTSPGKRFPEQGAEKCNFDCLGTGKQNSLADRNPSAHRVINGRRYNLYYNAFPIEEGGHFFYVPVIRKGIRETIPHIPQRLDRERVEDVLDISQKTADAVIFFNSIGAGASVDHFHVQQVNYSRKLKDGTPLRRNRFAIENAPVENFRGRKFLGDYPINGLVFSSPNAKNIWADVERFQSENIPFNWVLFGEKSYLLPRRPRTGEIELADSFASLECAGKIITNDLDLYRVFSKSHLLGNFDVLSLNKDAVLDVGSKDNYPLYDPCAQCAERLMGVAGSPCDGCRHAG